MFYYTKRVTIQNYTLKNYTTIIINLLRNILIQVEPIILYMKEKKIRIINIKDNVSKSQNRNNINKSK